MSASTDPLLWSQCQPQGAPDPRSKKQRGADQCGGRRASGEASHRGARSTEVATPHHNVWKDTCVEYADWRGQAFKPRTGPLARKTVDIPPYVPFHSMAFTCHARTQIHIAWCSSDRIWGYPGLSCEPFRHCSERSEAQHLNEKIRLEWCFIDLGRATRQVQSVQWSTMIH